MQQIMGDLFSAGMETIKTSLQWAVLFMLHHPNVMRAVQEELDQVVGRQRLPKLEDLAYLPVTESTILEVMRRSSIVPLGTTHAPTRWVNLWFVAGGVESLSRHTRSLKFIKIMGQQSNSHLRKSESLKTARKNYRSCNNVPAVRTGNDLTLRTIRIRTEFLNALRKLTRVANAFFLLQGCPTQRLPGAWEHAGGAPPSRRAHGPEFVGPTRAIQPLAVYQRRGKSHQTRILPSLWSWATNVPGGCFGAHGTVLVFLLPVAHFRFISTWRRYASFVERQRGRYNNSRCI